MTITPETIAELRALLADARADMIDRTPTSFVSDYLRKLSDAVPALLDIAESAQYAKWLPGAPDKIRASEWFIAETTYRDRVVLKAAPEEYAYYRDDFMTADENYIKADNIKRWMQFPDSEYLPQAAEHVGALEKRIAALEAENATLREALKPFAKEAEAWVSRTEGGAYNDTDKIVEPFPGYEGELNVGDLRRAAAVLKGEKA